MRKIIIFILVSLLMFVSCVNLTDVNSSDLASFESTIESSADEFSKLDNSVLTNETSVVFDAVIEAIEGYNYGTLKNFNKNSGGYIIEEENCLYFSNKDDENRLYKKELQIDSKPQKVGNLTSDFLFNCLQRYENKIVYLNTVSLVKPIETEYATVIYAHQLVCYDLETEKENVLIDSKTIIDFVVVDSYIYYTTYDEKQYGALCRMSLNDNSTETLMDLIYPMAIQENNGKLYLGYNELLSVYDIKKNTMSNHMMLHYGYAVCEDVVYFINIKDHCVYKMEYNSKFSTYDYENAQKLSDIRASSFNLYGNNLFVSELKTKNLYCIDIRTLQKRVLAKGGYPIITSVGVSYKSQANSIELFEFE